MSSKPVLEVGKCLLSPRARKENKHNVLSVTCWPRVLAVWRAAEVCFRSSEAWHTYACLNTTHLLIVCYRIVGAWVCMCFFDRNVWLLFFFDKYILNIMQSFFFPDLFKRWMNLWICEFETTRSENTLFRTIHTPAKSIYIITGVIVGIIFISLFTLFAFAVTGDFGTICLLNCFHLIVCLFRNQWKPLITNVLRRPPTYCTQSLVICTLHENMHWIYSGWETRTVFPSRLSYWWPCTVMSFEIMYWQI